MSNQKAVTILASAVSGACAAYVVFPRTGIYSALLTLVGFSWLVYRLLYPGKAFSTLEMLTMPPKNSLIWFFLSFIYLSFSGTQLAESFLISLGVSLVAFVVGITFHNIWNP